MCYKNLNIKLKLTDLELFLLPVRILDGTPVKTYSFQGSHKGTFMKVYS